MKHLVLVCAAVFVIGASAAAAAQGDAGSMSGPAIGIACAPPPSFDDAPAHALRIIGSQDTSARALFGDSDLLVLGGGTTAGVQLGQEFFIRRTMTFGGSKTSRGAKTLGWVRVVAVNDTTAIGFVEHACGGILTADYLVPFVAPMVPADVVGEPSGQPDFTTLGHVLVGNEDRETLGAGDFALIDWGQDRSLQAGARFSIYRDVGVKGMPLASIGEGVVISTGPSMALTRITRARDAVFGGDYIALRK